MHLLPGDEGGRMRPNPPQQPANAADGARLSGRDVGQTRMAEAAPRKPILAIIAFNVAVLLAIFSSSLSVTTFVPDVERSGLLWACSFGTLSAGLVAFSWRRMPRGLRFMGVGVVGLAALGGLYSASRLLG